MQKFRNCFISLILLQKVRKKTALLRCIFYNSGTGHMINFQPKNPAGAKLAAINNKNCCGMAEMQRRQFKIVSNHGYYHIRSGKRQLCSVVPPTKSALAISSIFSPNIHLRPNCKQSTTKMDVARLRCNADSSEEFHIIDTSVFVVYCCLFGPSWMFGLKIELMACAGMVGGTTEQSCLFPDLV